MHGGRQHGAWISRDGVKMKYWGGVVSRKDFYCACGETGLFTYHFDLIHGYGHFLKAPATQYFWKIFQVFLTPRLFRLRS